MRVWIRLLVVLLSSSPAIAIAGEPTSDPSSEKLAAQPDAEAAAPGEAAEPLPPGFADLAPEVRDALLAMDQAAIEALMQKAQQGETLDAREQALVDGVMHVSVARFDAGLSYQTGDVTVGDGLAVLHLGTSFRYLGPEDTEKVLVDVWGNPPGTPRLGMIVPADVSPVDQKRGWGVLVTYTEEGYVDDDDAEDIDYDELLASMQESTGAENEERVRQGYERVHVVGWAEPPHYDSARNSLYWAMELDFEGTPEHTLNYSIRVLGRRGVLELNAVSVMSRLAEIKPEMEKIFPLVEYQPGHRYADFNPDVDEVAAYGVGALIAGKAAAKVGLWAALVKFLIAAKKILIIGGIALFAGLAKLFGMRRKREEEAPPEQHDGSAP